MNPHFLLGEREAQLNRHDRRREAEKWRQAHPVSRRAGHQGPALRVLLGQAVARFHAALPRSREAGRLRPPELRKV